MVDQNTSITPTPTSPQAPAAAPAGYDTIVVDMPPQGQTTTVAVVPATEYQIETEGVSFAKDGNNLVAHANDGGTVVFEDYFTFASSELPPALTLADGAVIPQEQIMAELGNPDLNAAEPAAGPGAGAGGATSAGGGSAFAAYDPGDIGTGLSTLDLLGNLDLAFAPPDPLQDPGLTDLAEGSLSLEVISTTTDVPDVPDGIEGGTYAGIFEGAQPNAHIGNTDVATPILNVVFTPSDDEVVTQTTLTGFPVGIVLILSNGTEIPILTAGQQVVIPGGLETGIQITNVSPDSDADFDLTATVDIEDTSTGVQTASLTVTGTIVVDAVADVPTLHVKAEGTEGSDGEPGTQYSDTTHADDSHSFVVNEDHAASSEGTGHYVSDSVPAGVIELLGGKGTGELGTTFGELIATLTPGTTYNDASDQDPTTSLYDIGFTAASNDATDGSEELTKIEVRISNLDTLETSGSVGEPLVVNNVLWNDSAVYDGQIIFASATYADGTENLEQPVRVDVSVNDDGAVELVFTPVISDGEGGYTPLSDDAYDDVQVSTLDLSHLQVIEPQHASDSFDVSVVVTSEETNVTDTEITSDNNISTNTSSFSVDVRAVADAATGLAVAAASAVYVDGNVAEGSAEVTTSNDGATTITLFEGENVTPTFTANFADNDGSESHYIVVSVPEGWTASVLADSGWNLITDSEGNVAYSIDVTSATDAVTIDNGTVTVSGLTFTPDNVNTDVDTNIQVYAVSYDQDADGDTAVPVAVSSIDVTIVVDAVADAPEGLTAETHYQDDYVAAAPGGTLNVSGSVTFPDTDGSEDHYLVFNVPQGWSVGSGLLTQADIAGLQAGNDDVNGQQLAGELVPRSGSDDTHEYFVIKVEVDADGHATFYQVTETGLQAIDADTYGLSYVDGKVTYDISVEADINGGTQHDTLFVKAVTIEADTSGEEPHGDNNVESGYKSVDIVADAADDVTISGSGTAYEDGDGPADTVIQFGGQTLQGYAVTVALADNSSPENGASEQAVGNSYTVTSMDGAAGALYYTVDGGTSYQQVALGTTEVPLNAQLYFVPEQTNSDHDVTLGLSTTVVDPNSGATAVVTGSATVVVDAVADAPEIHLHQETGSTTISYAGQSASFANVIGVYTLDEAGNPTEPQILVVGGAYAPVDGSLVKTVDGDTTDLHFFIVSKGAETLHDVADNRLGFDIVDGKPVLTLDGNQVPNVYYDQQEFNSDGMPHAQVVLNSDGTYTVGFEDLSGQGDRDFNDIRVTVAPNVNYLEDGNHNAPVDDSLAIGIGFTANATDTDGSEEITSVTVTLTDSPAGTALALGDHTIGNNETIQVSATVQGSDTPTTIGMTVTITADADGNPVYTLTSEAADGVQVLAVDLNGLKAVLPSDSDDDFDVTVAVTSTETNLTGGELPDANNSTTTTSTFSVVVDAVADMPTDVTASASAATINETQAVTITASASFDDVVDKSEKHYILVEVPKNFTSDGATVTDGQGQSTSYELVHLTAADGNVAEGNYLKIPVDGQLHADGDTATVKVTFDSQNVDGISDTETAHTYGMAEEGADASSVAAGTEITTNNNVAISDAATVAITVLDTTPTISEPIALEVQEADLVTSATDQASGEVTVTASEDAVTVALSSTDIQVAGLVGNIVWLSSDGGATLTGYEDVDGDGTYDSSAPAITIRLVGNSALDAHQSATCTVTATLNAALQHTLGDDPVVISGIGVVATDADAHAPDVVSTTVTLTIADDSPDISLTIDDAHSETPAVDVAQGGVISGNLSHDHVSADGPETLTATFGTETRTIVAGGDAVTFANGSVLALQADGAWRLTVNDSVTTGDASLTFTATDTDKDSDVETVDFSIISGNQAPTAKDVSVEAVQAGSAIEVPLGGSDDHGVEAYKITSEPHDGTLYTLDADGTTHVSVYVDMEIPVGTTLYFQPSSSFDTANDNGGDPLTFTYVAVDGSNLESAPATVSITVDDVVPTAHADAAPVMEGTTATVNVVLVLDTSWSMGDKVKGSDGHDVTRFEILKQAVGNLLNTYGDALGGVMLTTFDGSAETHTDNSGSVWLTKDQVNDILSSQGLDFYTDYDDALASVMNNYDPPKGNTVVYFLSDGEPTSSDGYNPNSISPDEKAAWQAFVAKDENNITDVYAVGIGSGATLDYHNGWDEGLQAIASDGDHLIQVTDATKLPEVLEGTVDTATGNLIDNDTANADGWAPIPVAAVSYTDGGGVTHDATTETDGSYKIVVDGVGTLVVNAASGAYTFTPIEGLDVKDPLDLEFHYTIKDHDGSTSSSTLTITIEDSSDVTSGSVSDKTDTYDGETHGTAAVFTSYAPVGLGGFVTDPDYYDYSSKNSSEEFTTSAAATISADIEIEGYTKGGWNDVVKVYLEVKKGETWTKVSSPEIKYTENGDHGDVIFNVSEPGTYRLTVYGKDNSRDGDLKITVSDITGFTSQPMTVPGLQWEAAAAIAGVVTLGSYAEATTIGVEHLDQHGTPGADGVVTIDGTYGTLTFHTEGTNAGHYTYEPFDTLSAGGKDTFNIVLDQADHDHAVVTLDIDVAASRFTDGSIYEIQTANTSADEATHGVHLFANDEGLTLIGSHFADYLQGGEGNDHLIGGEGNDHLLGGGGNDTLEGGAGNDVLEGQGGNDHLDGGAGNDLLIGGEGDDVLTGGPGSDTFQFTSVTDGNDTITDFHLGTAADGGDTIDLDALFESLNINDAARDGMVSVTQGTGTNEFVVGVTGTNHSEFSVTVQVDNADGMSHDDIAAHIKAQVDTHGS